MILQRPRTRSLGSAAFCMLMLAAGCSDSEAAQKTPQGSSSPSTKGITMHEAKCAEDAVSRSVCMIRIILDDVEKESGGIGGGISEIKALSSDSYVVSLPREERVMQFTYEFGYEAGSVKLRKRTEGAKGF